MFKRIEQATTPFQNSRAASPRNGCDSGTPPIGLVHWFCHLVNIRDTWRRSGNIQVNKSNKTLHIRGGSVDNQLSFRNILTIQISARIYLLWNIIYFVVDAGPFRNVVVHVVIMQRQEYICIFLLVLNAAFLLSFTYISAKDFLLLFGQY